MSFATLAEKMLVFVVLMLIGFVCARTKYIGREFIKDASKIVINIFVVVTVINSAVGIDAPIGAGEMLHIMLVMAAMELICFVVGGVACCLTRLDSDKKPVYEMLVSVHNTAFIALPVIQQVFGAKAVFCCAVSCLPLNLLMYSYGIIRIKGHDRGKLRLRDLITTPLVASVLTFFIMLFRIKLPGIVTASLSAISGATLPMSMMVVGATLGGVSAKETFKEWWLYIMSFIKLIVAPLIVWFLLRFITSDPDLLNAAVVIAASPSAVTVSVVSIQYERDSVFASQGVLMSTALSMLTIPAVVYLLMNFA